MTYSIKDHLLSGPNVSYNESPNKGAAFGPELPDTLIMHYTAGPSLSSAVNWFKRPEAQASAHLVIDRDGRVVQMVPFDRIAWHAGNSAYAGRTGFNRYSIGIELVNAGFLTPHGEEFVDTYGHKYPASDVVQAIHKNENRQRWWQLYPAAQLEAALEIARELKVAYALKSLLGHDDIAPLRKQDPGPAFPIASFRTHVFEDLHTEEAEPPESLITETRKGIVTAAKLNIRQEPSIHAARLAEPLPAGTVLSITGREGDWLRVKVEITGWVAKQYVREQEE